MEQHGPEFLELETCLELLEYPEMFLTTQEMFAIYRIKRYY